MQASSIQFFFRPLGATLFVIGLTACTGMPVASLQNGLSQTEVIKKLGQPTHIYSEDGKPLLEYKHGPAGQTTYLAHISADGNLISYEQVLTTQKFAQIKIGVTTKDQVLHLVGAPSETSYLSLSKLEVWSYPYKEDRVWDSIMHIHFDQAGIVQKILNLPDPRYDADRHRVFGFHR